MKISTSPTAACIRSSLLFTLILLLTFNVQSQTVRMRANLYVVDAAGTTLMDGNMTNYNSMYSNAVDGYDIWKMTNFGENFGILRTAANLIIERRSPVAATDTSYFRLWNLVQGRQYRITVIAENLNANNRFGFVRDKYLNLDIPVVLHGTTSIDFSINAAPASYAQNRFTFIMADANMMAGPLPVTITSINARISNNAAQVFWNVENEMAMEKYVVQHAADGISFKDVAELAASGQARGSYSITDKNLTAKNYYRVKAISISGKIQYSPVVRLDSKMQSLNFEIYPNPVANKQMNLEVIAEQSGAYKLTLVNNFGQQVQLGSLSLQNGITRQQVILPASITPGIYHLKITTPDLKILQKTVTVL